MHKYLNQTEDHNPSIKQSALHIKNTRIIKGVIRIVPVLIPLLLLIVTGVRGIDFGHHWDEKFHVLGVKNTISSQILLPRIYFYPGVSYWLSLTSALPDIISYARSEDQNLEALLGAIEGKEYRLRSRILFLLTSSLAVLFVYLSVLIWRKNWIEAFLAASVLGLSWEVAYHIRWVAPDGVLIQFSALTLLFLVLARLKPETKIWLCLAAISAGLATGTKWPAGLLIIPVLIAQYQNVQKKTSPIQFIQSITKLFLVFCLAYLVTTPATLLDPIRVFKYLGLQQAIYSTGVEGSAVSPGLVHFYKILEYFAVAFPSHFFPISLLMFCFSAIGLYALFKESPNMSLLFLSFPVLYVVFFSIFGMMIVRNLLALGPFFAVLVARGIIFIYQKANYKILRGGLMMLVTFLITINAFWLVFASETIKSGNPNKYFQELGTYLKSHPNTRFSVSNKIWRNLVRMDGEPNQNVIRSHANKADQAVFLSSEMLNKVGMIRAPANRPWLTTTWFGPYEVNFNYYPGWKGSNRILVVPMKHAHELGFPFKQ